MADELQGSDSWQRARRPSQKRSREQSILNACKELISSIHPSDLNTSMIAKEAEISPSGLYRYYPTKESILFALYCQDLKNFSLRIRKSTIDADYRGEVKVILGNLGDKDEVIEHGDRVAQMVLCPVIQANFSVCDDLTSTARGSGGFGSTGKK